MSILVQRLQTKSRILTPPVAFALCLALTLGAAFFAYQNAQKENAGRLDRTIATFRDTLHNRMVVYTTAIIHTRNLFNVKPDLTEGEFHEFVEQMALRENYPGVQTLGYVQRLPLARAQKLQRDLHVPLDLQDAVAEAPNREADIVRYVEIINPESQSVRGVDLSSSPGRREAMDEARDSGLPVASSRVQPMQLLKTPNSVYAFLLFVPLYEKGRPISNVEERRQALKGFVYSGFRAPNLFGKMTADARFRSSDFIVKIYDGHGTEADHLMYAEGPASIENPLTTREFDFQFAGHTWTLHIVVPPSYSVSALRWLPQAVFFTGLLLSFLLSFALRRSQALAKQLGHDITEREKAERLLSEARIDAEQANRAKSIFLANISHEIRTPLGVMIGFSELALGQTNATEREESLRTVIRNGHELTRIIGDVLDVSKIEAQTLKIENVAFSLEGMVREVIRTWQPQFESKGVSFLTTIDKKLPRVITSDETRIKQVLTNLFSNALKFTSIGSVRFTVACKELDGRRVQISFTVTDSGIGVSTAQRERLFKPFSQGDSSITRKYGGSGLGLALSQAIAQTLGGELLLSEAAPNRAGSEFTITFPVYVPVSRSLESSAVEPVVSLSGRQVLIVDDSPDNRALVSLMLKKAGAKVDVAADGDEGVQKALNRVYDLILMDIQMPNKDGYTALHELRKDHKQMTPPVIALTAHALNEERDRALRSGFAGYMTKPVDRENLIRVSAETIAAALHLA